MRGKRATNYLSTLVRPLYGVLASAVLRRAMSRIAPLTAAAAVI